MTQEPDAIAETDLDRARREGGEAAWESAICAVEFVVANWDQDTRSREASDALNKAGASIVEALRDAGPTEFRGMRWKAAENAVAAEAETARLSLELKTVKESERRLRAFVLDEERRAENAVTSSFMPVHTEAALARCRRIREALGTMTD